MVESPRRLVGSPAIQQSTRTIRSSRTASVGSVTFPAFGPTLGWAHGRPPARLVVVLALAAAAVALLAPPLRTMTVSAVRPACPGEPFWALCRRFRGSRGSRRALDAPARPHPGSGSFRDTTEHQLRASRPRSSARSTHANMRCSAAPSARRPLRESSQLACRLSGGCGPPAEVGRGGRPSRIHVMAIHPRDAANRTDHPLRVSEGPDALATATAANVPNEAQAWLWDPANGS